MAASLRRPTIGAIYDQRQGQVKNAEIAVFCGFFFKGTSLVRQGWNRYLAGGPIRGLVRWIWHSLRDRREF
jgi:hypothetical protein